MSALLGLSRLEGVGPLVAVIGLASLAQFVMHSSLVLYTTFKFGWGPAQNGWSLFAVGLTSVFVQGFLLKHLLKRFSPQRLAVTGLVASTLTYLGLGLASEGWMMYRRDRRRHDARRAVRPRSSRAMVSNAADARTQGQTMGVGVRRSTA